MRPRNSDAKELVKTLNAQLAEARNALDEARATMEARQSDVARITAELQAAVSGGWNG